MAVAERRGRLPDSAEQAGGRAQPASAAERKPEPQPRGAKQRGRTGVDGVEHDAEVLAVHRPVLRVDEQPVEALSRSPHAVECAVELLCSGAAGTDGVGHLLGDGGGVRVDEEAHLVLARRQGVLEVLAGDAAARLPALGRFWGPPKRISGK